MRGRAAGITLMALGAALAVMPAFAWYSVPRAGGDVRASGFDGAGQLLLMPVLGALAVVAGAVLVSAGRGRDAPGASRAGALAAAAGAVCLGFALWAASAPRVELTVVLPDGTETVPSRVEVEPAAAVAVALAGALLVVGTAVAWSGRRG